MYVWGEMIFCVVTDVYQLVWMMGMTMMMMVDNMVVVGDGDDGDDDGDDDDNGDDNDGDGVLHKNNKT